MAKVTKKEAVTETKVIEISPARVTLDMTEDEAIALYALLGKSHSSEGDPVFRNLYADLGTVVNYGQTAKFSISALGGRYLDTYIITRRP